MSTELRSEDYEQHYLIGGDLGPLRDCWRWCKKYHYTISGEDDIKTFHQKLVAETTEAEKILKRCEEELAEYKITAEQQYQDQLKQYNTLSRWSKFWAEEPRRDAEKNFWPRSKQYSTICDNLNTAKNTLKWNMDQLKKIDNSDPRYLVLTYINDNKPPYAYTLMCRKVD